MTLSRVAISLSYQMFGNLAIEFWPEIHRKVLGQKQGSQNSQLLNHEKAGSHQGGFSSLDITVFRADDN